MTDDVTSRLAAIEQRANAASQGPWRVDGPHYWDEDDLANVVTDPNREPVALQPSTSMRRPWGRRQDSGWPGHNDDIAFIAHARADVPWLIGRIGLALTILRDATPTEERREAQGTHSPNCHQYHIGCLVTMLRRVFEGEAP